MSLTDSLNKGWIQKLTLLAEFVSPDEMADIVYEVLQNVFSPNVIPFAIFATVIIIVHDFRNTLTELNYTNREDSIVHFETLRSLLQESRDELRRIREATLRIRRRSRNAAEVPSSTGSTSPVAAADASEAEE